MCQVRHAVGFAQVVHPLPWQCRQVADMGERAGECAAWRVPAVHFAARVDRRPDHGIPVAGLQDVDPLDGAALPRQSLGHLVEQVACRRVDAVRRTAPRGRQRAQLLCEFADAFRPVRLDLMALLRVDVQHEHAFGDDDARVRVRGRLRPDLYLFVGDGFAAASRETAGRRGLASLGQGDDLHPSSRTVQGCGCRVSVDVGHSWNSFDVM